MKLTTRGRYAVTAMFDLALHSQVYPVSLSEISERQRISLSYLEQLFAKLRKSGLVISTRGPGGGYTVAKATDSVSIAEIIGAVNESVDATNCGGRENCSGDGEGPCLTHNLWAGLTRQINDFLQSVTLADLLADQPVGRDLDLAGIKIVQERIPSNTGGESVDG